MKRHEYRAKPCYVILQELSLVDAESVKRFASNGEALRYIVLHDGDVRKCVLAMRKRKRCTGLGR